MAQEKLQVGLEYDVKGVALAKLEKNIEDEKWENLSQD